MNEFMQYMTKQQAGRDYVTIFLVLLSIGVNTLAIMLETSPLPFIANFRQEIIKGYWGLILCCYLCFFFFVLLIWKY